MGAVIMKGAGRGRPGVKRGRPAHNRKLNAGRVVQLAAQGLSTYEIARSQGVNHSSVHRFLESYQIQKKETEAYKINRAELLSFTGSKLNAAASSLVDQIQSDIDNGITAALSPDAKGKLARDLSVVYGVIFDKERLERGQSTQNHSLITRMMGPALKEAGKEVSTSNESS